MAARHAIGSSVFQGVTTGTRTALQLDMRHIILGMLLLCAIARSVDAGPPPRIFVAITNVVDQAERDQRVDAIRRSLGEVLAAHGVDARQVDVAVTLREQPGATDRELELCAEVRVVISTGDHQIRSFLTGTARIALNRRAASGSRLGALRTQLLDDALETIRRRIRALAPRRVS
jgi:hypothetical protein